MWKGEEMEKDKAWANVASKWLVTYRVSEAISVMSSVVVWLVQVSRWLAKS